MLYGAEVTVCSEIRSRYKTHKLQLLNFKPVGASRKHKVDIYVLFVALKRSNIMRIEYQMGIKNLRLSKLINNIPACLSLGQ